MRRCAKKKKKKLKMEIIFDVQAKGATRELRAFAEATGHPTGNGGKISYNPTWLMWARGTNELKSHAKQMETEDLISPNQKGRRVSCGDRK